jgi:hypothetical protein
MKGFVAICFFFLALAFVSGKPGGYTANNDLVKVKFDEDKWGDAKRAGHSFCQLYPVTFLFEAFMPDLFVS